MFGTLVSANFDRETLEYIENPDPVAAVSRTVQDKIRIACIICRSRKVRCSGEGKRCQRCISMGLECVYPKYQGRNKRRERNKARRTTIRRGKNIATRTVCDEAEPCVRNDQAKYSEELVVDDFDDTTFADSSFDESLFAPWIMDTAMQSNINASSESNTNKNSTSTVDTTVDIATNESSLSPKSCNATAVSPIQLLDLSTAEISMTSLLRPSTAGGTDSFESLEGSHTTYGDVAWTINGDGNSTAGSTPGPLLLDPCGKAHTKSDGCCCLLNSISFLERLTSRSTSHENRIDLLLADVRNSIETLATFISCERCAVRVEQDILLAMAARQISIICGKTANCYKTMRLCALGKNASVGAVDISVSTYRVNQHEKLHLLGSLVALQILECQQHINTIKARYRDRPSKGHAEALIEAENHIKLARVTISSYL
ncbi:hypothetical protein MGYG_03809 [Nannizzia gypsea CBS 118893]|uniref:Zn(2)-C6 fungal-type domain-containing protein n=1 Tax=Arthroderma gypseum (strain ATCC MYA-4604 / CBS 118893) TaxID=535722 RepID=E4UTZ8_ARTGP|nr:hypothetical protein MGYG_03809 [Nannizzia gypsea CBS 118893]EFR00804.1 hypothetical protein MGYG_03809 [Nannizzia gypsea CBS 118893]